MQHHQSVMDLTYNWLEQVLVGSSVNLHSNADDPERFGFVVVFDIYPLLGYNGLTTLMIGHSSNWVSISFSISLRHF